MTLEELTEWRKNLKPGDKVWFRWYDHRRWPGHCYRISEEEVFDIKDSFWNGMYIEADGSDHEVKVKDLYPSFNDCLMAYYTEKSRFLSEKFQEGLRALSESLSIEREMNRLVEEDFRDWEKFHNERKP